MMFSFPSQDKNSTDQKPPTLEATRFVAEAEQLSLIADLAKRIKESSVDERGRCLGLKEFRDALATVPSRTVELLNSTVGSITEEMHRNWDNQPALLIPLLAAPPFNLGNTDEVLDLIHQIQADSIHYFWEDAFAATERLITEIESCIEADPDIVSRRLHRNEILTRFETWARTNHLKPTDGDKTLSFDQLCLENTRILNLGLYAGGLEFEAYDCAELRRLNQTLTRYFAWDTQGTIVPEHLASEFHKNSFPELVEKWGAKGACLLKLLDLLKSGVASSESCPPVKVPSFTLTQTSTFLDWKAGRDITRSLREVFEWARGKEVIARSSASKAEDNHAHTGAGIYLSKRLPYCPTFEEFRDCIIQIFESVDSEIAVNYRSSLGITEEAMGCVIQEYIAGDSTRDKGPGYVNTVRAGAPQLLEVVHHGIRAVFKKLPDEEEIEPFCALDNDRINIFTVTEIAQATMELEKSWGEPLQIEYVKTTALNLVQARPLPPAYTAAPTVSFIHDKEALFTCSALGVVDEDLTILSPEDEPSKKRGVVIFGTGHMASDYINDVVRVLPKEGAVIILVPSNNFHGHIETLAIERGLAVLFRTREQAMACVRDSMPEEFTGDHYEVEGRLLHSWNGMKTLRIIANGIEARIYPS